MENIRAETIELNLLLEAIHVRYGYDFRNYSKASVRRRVTAFIEEWKLPNLSALQHRILYEEEVFAALLDKMSVNVTEMFRDPDFYRALLAAVLPELKRRSVVKIWHAGCATGEEVYSLAILLKEAGIYDKCRIYATDMDEGVLEKAREAIYPVAPMKDYSTGYIKAGGRRSLSDYYKAKYDRVLLDSSLKENVLFSSHNLATDSAFGEMDIVICRNVLIYFDRELQDRVFGLFKESLGRGGFLCLGAKETIRVSRHSEDFADVAPRQRIYRLK